MALPSVGEISFGDINVELGKSKTASISLNDSDVRRLANIPSGRISIDDLKGRSAWVERWAVSINTTLSRNGRQTLHDEYQNILIGNSIKTVTLDINGFYQDNFTRYTGRVYVDGLQSSYSIQLFVNTVDGLRTVSFINGSAKTIFEKSAVCDLKIISLEIVQNKN